MIFGVPRGFAVELAEMTNVVKRNRWMTEAFVFSVDRLCAGKMEHGPEQHRGVAVREHETVPVRPDRVLGIEAHDAIPECVHQRRERHGRAGVPGLGLLYRIHRKRANGIDCQLNNLLIVRHGFLPYFFPISREATLPRRRRCRSAWLNLAAKNVWTRSQATAGPTVLPPIHRMFM